MSAGGFGQEPSSGWLDSYLRGRTKADYEADADANRRLFGLAWGVVLGVGLATKLLFGAVELPLGWWGIPPFFCLYAWIVLSLFASRALRPVELDRMPVLLRLAVAPPLALGLWALWPVWASGAARAWKHSHGFGRLIKGHFGYPLGSIIDASPLGFGAIVFLMIALVAVIAPRTRAAEEQVASEERERWLAERQHAPPREMTGLYSESGGRLPGTS